MKTRDYSLELEIGAIFVAGVLAFGGAIAHQYRTIYQEALPIINRRILEDNIWDASKIYYDVSTMEDSSRSEEVGGRFEVIEKDLSNVLSAAEDNRSAARELFSRNI